MSQWEVATFDGYDHVHILPIDDLIEHDENDDGECICGTETEPVERADGSIAWLYHHNSLDGRERLE